MTEPERPPRAAMTATMISDVMIHHLFHINAASFFPADPAARRLDPYVRTYAAHRHDRYAGTFAIHGIDSVQSVFFTIRRQL